MSAMVETAAPIPPENTIMKMITGDKNPRGIPSAKFIESVEDFLSNNIVSVEVALGALNELYSKYKYMESSFLKSKSVYKSKIPETEQTLELVKMMQKKRDDNDGDDMFVNYSLCDTVYSKAKIDTDEGKVCLWIGASTMVEYSYEEAIALLTEQVANQHLKVQELDEDLYHLRGSSITVEVNMARLFNYSVKIKKAAEAAAAVAAKK